MSEKRKPKQTNQQQPSGNLTPKKFEPLTDNQEFFFDNFRSNDVISLVGCAGTGKTFQAIYKGLEAVSDKRTDYHKLIIVRSSVSGRDIGFLKGSAAEKMQIYETPYIKIVNKIYGRDDAYDIATKKGTIEFHPTSFLRGLTLDDCIIVVDEAQNCSYQELFTILTRVGENCKVVITGDTAQDDLTSKRYNEESGYPEIKRILDKVDSCLEITYSVDDIVRSGFVKEFIIAAQERASEKKAKKPEFDISQIGDIMRRDKINPIGDIMPTPFGDRWPKTTTPWVPNSPEDFRRYWMQTSMTGTIYNEDKEGA